MATLSGNKIKDTYQSLIKLTDNGNLTTGAKQLTDGFGNNSPLYISTTQIGIGVTPEATYDLHVYSNAKVGGNLTVTGDLTVEGTTTTIDTQTLTVEDPLIEVASNNTSTDAVDIGWYGKYAPSGTTLYAGLFRDTGDSKFKLFRNLEEQPTTTVNTSGTGYTVATLVADVEGTLTGTIASSTVATTQSAGDNSTKVATTAYVDSSAGNYLPLAGGTMSGSIAMGGNNISGGGTATFSSFVGDLTGNADTATALETARTIQVSGDVAGSASFDGTGDINISTTIQPNSVALGTDTTGNYVATISGTANEVTVTGSGTENAAVTISLPNSISVDVRGDLYGDIYNADDSIILNTGDDSNDAVLSDGVRATTQSQGDNSTKLATTAYVDSAIGGQDTLAEILANGNTTGGTDIAITSGDKITNFTSTGIDDNATSTAITIDSSENVGINDTVSGNFNTNYDTKLLVGGEIIARSLTANQSMVSIGGDSTSAFIKSGKQDGSLTGRDLRFVRGSDEKLRVTNTGISVTGNVDLGDDDIIQLGDSDDLKIYHNTVDQEDSIIEATNHNLRIINTANDSNVTIQTDNGSGSITNYLIANGFSGAVELYHYGSKKFETTSSGVNTTGIMEITSSGVGVIGAVGNTANDVNIYSTTAGHNGLRMHVNGILPTDHTGTIIDNDADLGDPSYRFKDLYLGGNVETAADKRISVGTWDNSGFGSGAAYGFSVTSSTPLLHLTESDQTNKKGYIGLTGGNMYVGGLISNLYLQTGTSGSTALTIDSSQNATFAGIVTANGFRTTSGSTDYSLLTRNSSNTAVYIQQAGSGNIVDFRYGSQAAGQGTSAMVVDSSGNVGIGQTPSTAKLEVAGEARVYTGSNLGYWGVDAGNSYVYFGTNTSNYDLSFQTSGTERMRIDSNGNSIFAGSITTTSPTGIKIDTTGNAILELDGASGSTEAIIFRHSGTEVSRISHSNSTNLVFSTGSFVTTALTLDTSQNANFTGSVGIGTTSTDAKLNVVHPNSGTDETKKEIQRWLHDGQNATSLFAYGNTADTIQLAAWNGEQNISIVTENLSSLTKDTTKGIYIKSGGNVGIGETNPQRPLHINGTEGVARFTSTASGNDGFEVGIGTSSQAFLWQSENSYMQFATNNTERMRIDSSGRTSIIGVFESPTSEGILNLKQSSGVGSLGMGFYDGGTNPHFWLQSRSYSNYSTTYNLALQPTGGNVGINFTSPNSKLYVKGSSSVVAGRFWGEAGTVAPLELAQNSGGGFLAKFYSDTFSTVCGSISHSGSATAFNTSSDYRLKENVVEMTGALDRVEQLKPSRFNFIGHEEIVDGFLAHEVSDIVPEAITGTKDEVDAEGNPVYQGIDQSKLVPLLVGAIQELKAEIETLKAQINN